MKKVLPPCIVLGRSPTALYAIRELGRAKVPICSEGNRSYTANWSKYLTHKPSTIDGNTDEERLSLLLDSVRSDSNQKAYLIASSDQDIAFIGRNLDILSKHFYLQGSYLNGLAEKLMDKSQLYDLCMDHNLPIPRTWIRNRTGLREINNQLHYPCLIKPSLIHKVKESMVGKKLWVAESINDYNTIVAKLPLGNTSWIVQEIVSGPESEIWLYAAYFDTNFEPREAFTARKLRQFPPGFGSASLVCSEDNQEVKTVCESFLKKLSYQGIVAAELKRDAIDGKLKLIEINPRPSLWFGVTTSANRFISLAAYLDGVGENPGKEKTQLNGVQWRYLFKDVYSMLFYRRNQTFILPPPELYPDGRPLKKTWAVFSYDDIKPVFGEIFHYIKKSIDRTIVKQKSK